jgi:prepilin-type N-terminal cleavage/methylation domain-containing protein
MNRRGLSLLEVMVALAILGGALAAITQLVRLGAQSGVAARENTTAQLLCEAKLAEITAGILPADPGGPWQFDLPEHAEWLYYVDTQPLPQAGLVELRVTVFQDKPESIRPISFQLVRWIQDPGLVFSDPLEEEAAMSETGVATNGM